MSAPIEFWFDFSSPYAYFAAMEIERRLDRFGRPLAWRPFLLGVAFQRTGMVPMVDIPMRGDYTHRDCTRIARMLGVPFHFPPDHPFGSQVAARAFYWFEIHMPQAATRFARAVFSRYYGDGRDVRTIEGVLEIASEFDCDLGALAEWLPGSEAKALLRARCSEALAKGVFGSPFLIMDDEPFWGWDRIPMAAHWLEHGTWDDRSRTDKEAI
ncbi:MAG TPA: 2-hydroxychromene-2-carboxylate isomerase [Devosiaceae bacterium]